MNARALVLVVLLSLGWLAGCTPSGTPGHGVSLTAQQDQALRARMDLAFTDR